MIRRRSPLPIRSLALLVGALAGSATVLTGCNTGAEAVFEHAQGTPRRMSESIADRRRKDTPYELAITGPIGLDVNLFNGSVDVRVDPDAEFVTLVFTRGASHGYERKDEAEAALLDDLTYDFEIVPGALGRVLQVTAETESLEPHFLRVDVSIEVPELENVSIRTGSGDVSVMNGQGTVDIDVRRGDIRYLTMTPVRQSVRMITGRGNVDLRVRGESTGAVLAESIRGDVRHRVIRGRWIVKPGTTYNRMIGSLNDGRNPIELRTVEGIVRFASIPDPLDVGAMILD